MNKYRNKPVVKDAVDAYQLEQDTAVSFLNAQRLDDIEGRFAFGRTTQSDIRLLIQVVRGLHRNRQRLETEIAALKRSKS